VLRQVTQTPHIAGPLGVRVSPDYITITAKDS